MNTKLLFRLASSGLFIVAIILSDYSNFSISSSYDSIVILLAALVLWFVPRFLSPITDIKKAIRYQNILIAFLVFVALFNLVMILINPSEIKYYGWLIVSICFIISNLLNKKENIKNLNNT